MCFGQSIKLPALKPTILIVAESLTAGNGGINRVARASARAIQSFCHENGYDCRAISLNDPIDATFEETPLISCNGSRIKFLAQVQMSSLRATHILFDSAAMARAHLIGRLFRRKTACWIHGIEIWKCLAHQKSVKRKRQVASRMDYIIANSKTTIDRSGFDRALKCWLATESSETPPPAEPISHRKRVLLLSTITVDYKGHREILECWPSVVAKHPDVLLCFAGKGPGLNLLRKTVAQHPNAPNIEVLGFVAEKELDSLFAKTRILAMPSRGEGFGIVYIEAMRHGIPVIASVHDAGCEINIDTVTGINVDLDTEGSLAKAIIQLLSDDAACERMGQHGRDRWSENYSYARFEARFKRFLENFVRKRG